LAVQSPSLKVAEAFVQVANECRLHLARLDQIQLIRHTENSDLIYWKTFPEVYELRMPLRQGDPIFAPNWKLYGARRIWWRSVTELGNL